jgi:hypothetical protein
LCEYHTTTKSNDIEISINHRNKKREHNLFSNESHTRYDKTYDKETDATYTGIFLFILTIVLSLSQTFKFIDAATYKQIVTYSTIGTFLLRIVITIWVVNIAKRQNRETIGWGILAFFFPSIILIIISLQKKLIAKFNLNSNLSNLENSQNLSNRASKYLQDKKYNESIRFAEKSIELNQSNTLAFEILKKARKEKSENEISNMYTQIEFRDKKNDKVTYEIVRKSKYWDLFKGNVIEYHLSYNSGLFIDKFIFIPSRKKYGYFIGNNCRYFDNLENCIADFYEFLVRKKSRLH